MPTIARVRAGPLSARDLPSVDRLLHDDRLAHLPRALAVEAARQMLDEAPRAAERRLAARSR